MREFAFELALCAALEERRDGIVARQLGAGVAEPGGRVVDVVRVAPGPEFDDRAAITGETIPDAAIESDVGPGRARYWKDAFDCDAERARRATERACEIGFFERERRGGRDYVRQVTRYPDWYGPIVGIENKPDLGRPGDLETQMRTDASLALFDRAVLATASHVTRAHLNRIPEAVGVWRFEPAEGTLEVIREPEPLPTERPGIERLEARSDRTDVAVISAAAKARARRRLAERAYGKGWRTYGIPACANCEPGGGGGSDGGGPASTGDGQDPGATLPYCSWAGRIVDAASECGPSCPAYEPAERAVDLESEREARTPWVADPAGRRRRQAGLDRFS